MFLKESVTTHIMFLLKEEEEEVIEDVTEKVSEQLEKTKIAEVPDEKATVQDTVQLLKLVFNFYTEAIKKIMVLRLILFINLSKKKRFHNLLLVNNSSKNFSSTKNIKLSKFHRKLWFLI